MNPEPNDLSRAVSRVVRLLMEADGLSARGLAAESGLTKDTGRLLFNGTTSLTIDLIESVSQSSLGDVRYEAQPAPSAGYTVEPHPATERT